MKRRSVSLYALRGFSQSCRPSIYAFVDGLFIISSIFIFAITSSPPFDVKLKPGKPLTPAWLGMRWIDNQTPVAVLIPECQDGLVYIPGETIFNQTGS